MKIKKADKVKILQGKDSGKTGTVEKTFAKSQKVLVTGLNLYKRHTKARSEDQKGSIQEISRPLPVSSVALICPKCKEATRIGYKVTAKDKVRVCRKCDQEIG